MATSDRLPSHPTKDGRATDSCLALIEANHCSILMVDANQGETAVCGCSILCWMIGEAVTVAANRTAVPLAMVPVLLTWSGGVKSSDYYHLSQVEVWMAASTPTVSLHMWKEIHSGTRLQLSLWWVSFSEAQRHQRYHCRLSHRSLS